MSLDLGTLRGFLELDDTGIDQGLDTAKSKLEGFTSDGAKIAGAAGIAIAGALTASLVKGMGIEAGNDKLATQLGLTEKQAAQAGRVAGDLYANNYGESLEQVNDATGAVISSIKGMRRASDTELQAATKAALNYAATFDIDVNKAVSVAGVVMKSGLAKNATEAFDLITAASQRVPAQLREDVLDAAEEYSQFFSGLGYSGEQAFAMLVEGSKKGMYGIDKAGDAIKEFTIRTTDGSKSTALAMESIGLNADEMSNKILKGGPAAQEATQKIIKGLLGVKDPSARAQAAIALFGTPLEDLNVKEIPKFLESMKSGGDAMKGFSGSAEEMDRTLNDNAVASLGALKRQAEMAFGSLMNWALPAVNDLTAALATGLGPAISATIDWLKENKAVVKPLAAAVVGAAGAFAIVVGVVKAWTLAQAALNFVLAANPIGIVIVILGALVGVLIYAYKKSDTFRRIVDAAMRAVGSAAKWLWEKAIKPAFAAAKKAFDALGQAGRWLWNNALQPAFKLIVGGVAALMRMWATMLRGLSNVPGFGWAAKAATAMDRAAGKAQALADSINKIPPDKDIFVRYHETTIRSVINKQANDPRLVGRNAVGTPNWRGGLSWVGENGPELVDLPAGARVWSNGESMAKVRAGEAPGGRSGPDIHQHFPASASPEAAAAAAGQRVVTVLEAMGV